MANGRRKTGPVTESVLGEITPDVPISYGQKYVAEGGNLTYVLDEDAAEGILARRDDAEAKGYDVVDLRDTV